LETIFHIKFSRFLIRVYSYEAAPRAIIKKKKGLDIMKKLASDFLFLCLQMHTKAAYFYGRVESVMTVFRKFSAEATVHFGGVV
jgi:hypothetical protein